MSFDGICGHAAHIRALHNGDAAQPFSGAGRKPLLRKEGFMSNAAHVQYLPPLRCSRRHVLVQAGTNFDRNESAVNRCESLVAYCLGRSQ
jgi:hypothetical protein